MKIFLDTANLEQIKDAWSAGIIDGVTTNPTLLAKEGLDFDSLIREITKIVDGPISVEAVELESVESIVKNARSLAKVSKNIVIKIPITKDGLKAVKILAKEQIKTNVTLVFSANQALLAAKANATYVSPFIGRLDDIGNEGMQIIRDILQIYKNYNFKTEVIVASIRHPIHVLEAAKLAAHIATVPYEVLMKMLRHALTEKGIKTFAEDWEKVKKRK
jgi:transaldolase